MVRDAWRDAIASKTMKLCNLITGWMIAALISCYMGQVCRAEPTDEVESYFQETVRPILTTYCFDCHADGAEEGGLSFENTASDRELIQNRELWWAVLKNLRAGIMPPADQDRPSAEEQKQVTDWIKTSVFGVDPNWTAPL